LQTESDELPPPEKAFDWPNQAIREKNWSEAAQRWSVLRKAYPNHPATWFQGANAHIEAGELNPAEALIAYTQAQFPNHIGNLTIASSLAMRQKDWEAAEDFLRQARAKHPDNLQTWLKSAEYEDQQGNREQAATYLQRACQCTPGQPGPFIQLAELAMRTENWEQALEHWETVRNHFPDNPNGYLRAAEAARKLGRKHEARQLTLAHQYGADFLDSEPSDRSTPNRRSRQENFKWLLELIWTMAIFNLRSEVHRNYLSFAWWVLEPLLQMVVYYVVFGLLLQRGGENFVTFLLTGLIPWIWFSKAVSGSSNSIMSGQNLILQVGVPSVVFPLVSLTQATLKQIPVFLLLFVFIWFQGFPIGSQWWALLPVILVQALLITAFASMVAAVIPFARDLSYLVPTGLTFLLFMSGIFYDYRTIPEEWQAYFLLNPMAFLLKSYREIFMDGILPDMATLTWWGIGSFVACLLQLLAYRRLRYIYPRIILE